MAKFAPVMAASLALLIFGSVMPVADPGDTLYAKGSNVNVRAAPSTDASIVIQIDRGHKLMEFGRSGQWVNVGVERTGGKDGWVHSSLVTPNFSEGATTPPPDPKFIRFKTAVESLNQRVKAITGAIFFDKVESLGDGIVQLRATPTWLAGSPSDKESNLRTLFQLWDAADGSGMPIRVKIINGSGQLIMQQSRRH